MTWRRNEFIGERHPLSVASRHESASPATGSHSTHQLEQKMLNEVQRNEASDLSAELRGARSYVEDLTARAPDPAKLADRLEIAAAWDAVYESAAPWAEYALAMRAAAWDAVMRPAKKLNSAYTYASSDDASIAKRYPHVASFFAARAAQAMRGAKTRKAGQKAKAKNASAGVGGAG